MELEHIIKLVETVSESHLTQFSFEQEGLVIKMKTDKEKCAVTFTESRQGETQNVFNTQAKLESAEVKSDGENMIKSPLVGTFYAASSPEDEPFVKVGDRVTKGQVLGIVEAMKLLNEIESEYDGIVKEILVSNEQVVEFDQNMFIIKS